MNKHILYISSFNEKVIKSLSEDIRNLGRITGESLWGAPLDAGISEGSILYLDSAIMGNLPLMASSLGAPLIEYVFFDFENDRKIFLISMLLSKEFKEGEMVFKMRENTLDLLIKRCKTLDRENEGLDFQIVDEDPFFRTKLYRERKSLIKGAIELGTYEECEAEEILTKESVSDVYITDPFTKDKALFNLEKALLIKPSAVHIISERADIYAPYSSLNSMVFRSDEKSIKEALCALMLDFSDNGKIKSIKRLKSFFQGLGSDKKIMEQFKKAAK